MLRNDAMTSTDRLQPGLFFCLCTRTRKLGMGKKSDAQAVRRGRAASYGDDQSRP